MARGDIYHHKDWRFRDGDSAAKFLIVLHDAPPFLVVKTTSRFKNLIATTGCLALRQAFMIAAGSCKAFPVDTLVQITDIYEWDLAAFMADIKTKKAESRGALPEKMISDLMQCLNGLQDDVEEKYFKILFP